MFINIEVGKFSGVLSDAIVENMKEIGSLYWKHRASQVCVCMLQLSETSPEFWQMSNMEYLHWGYGVCRYVLSIEYDYGIFALGVCDMHHHHCWDGGQIDQGG